MLTVALAAAFALATPKAVLEAVDATDSATKVRAAYALARVYDTSSTTESALVERLLVSGFAGQRAAVIRGLSTRRDPPTSFREKLPSLLLDRDAIVVSAAVEAVRWLPHDDAVTLVLNRENGTSASGPSLVGYAIALDDDRLRPAVDKYLKLAGADLPSVQDKCTIEGCLGLLRLMAWEKHDLSAIRKRYAGTEFLSTYENKIALAELDAATADPAALQTLTEALRGTADPAVRYRILLALLDAPPFPRREAIDAAVIATGDGNNGNRALAYGLLTALATRVGDRSALEHAFHDGLSDPNVDVRLECAIGLLDLGVHPADAAERAKKENDVAVRALLEALSHGS